ncbi:MAG: DUF1918 domain-containing protein [Acidimicrobiales bacterium]
MQGNVGDHVVIEGTHVGDPGRRGKIVEVIPGREGEHYRIRWERDEHESIFFPGPGTRIETTPGREG